MELLTRHHDKKNSSPPSEWDGISKQLRTPANSRLQKLHNVGLVFKKFNGVKLAGGEGETIIFNFKKVLLS